MSDQKLSVIQRIGQSRLILGAFVLAALILVAVSAVRFQSPELLGREKILTDFDAFYLAGTLAGRGDIASAYDMASVLQEQQRMWSATSFMPWTYPPPFTLIMDGISNVPIGLAYVLFTLASFGFYLAVLHRIAGQYLVGVLLFMMPVVLLNLRTGQNGFLTAGLIGMFLLAWRNHRAIAGLPLGLMIIKPHLAVGVGLLALIGRRWDVLTIAASVGLAALALATFAYGWPVWGAFLGAVREASGFLAQGYYPLFRMNSVYASLWSWGLPAAWAMAGHVAGALVAVGLLIWASLAAMEFRYRAALICVLSLFVSPYSYDYDLTILGVGLAFVLPDLLDRGSPRALGGLLALAWLTGGYGMSIHLFPADTASGLVELSASAEPALICPLLIALCVATLRILRSPPRTLGLQVPSQTNAA